MRSIIIGTAGHIDHGKTALVKALTGVDTDRLPEEKARGITIDLGFAHVALGGMQVSFIDVPGHERFVRNMLAGIGGVDLLMLVVAADESVMPQTREHFEICRLLGIQSGFVAITKIDLVDSDTLQSARRDIAELVRGSFLEGAPVVGVSSRTGEGMDDLRKLLERLAAEIPPRSNDGFLRLPVDRVFTLKGRGTVVTGTLMTGKLSRESTIEILPQHRKARVRSVHAHDAPVELAVAGQRTALNLQGVEKEEVHRGDVLTQPGIFENTNLIDARITLLSNSMPLRNNAIVRLHHLASDTPARITFPGRDSLLAGESAIAQVRLQRPLFALYGDRFILRKHSPLTTIGGGLILDHQPARRIRKKDVDAIAGMERLERASLEERLLLAVQERGLQGASQKTLQAKLARSADQLGNLKVDGVVWLQKNPLLAISSSSLQTLLDRTVESVSEYHKTHPLFPGMPKQEILGGLPIPKEIVSEVLDIAGKKGLIALRKDSVSLPGWSPAASESEQVLSTSAEASLIQHRLEFPQLDAWARELAVSLEQAKKILYWLVRENRAIKIDDDYFIHSTVWADLKQRIKALKDTRKTFGVADFKTLFGVSRKYAIPLLERLDREGVTRRAGNERIIL